MKNKSGLYNKLWGVHYRELYSTPVTADAVTLQALQGGMEIMEQAVDFHALVLSNRRNRLYMLKPLGGSTSFLESKFFREMYNLSGMLIPLSILIPFLRSTGWQNRQA